MLGTFKNGQPRILIQVKGAGEYAEIEAIVDSGFNGYLKIPYEVAFPLGLSLMLIQGGIIVADGNSTACLVCEGEVCIDGKCIKTSIDVHPANVIQIGTALLRELKKTFTIDPVNSKVEITDSIEPKKAFEAVAGKI